jgi:hypothetical protein
VESTLKTINCNIKIKYILQKYNVGWCWRFRPIILDTWEAEIRRISI